MKVTITINDKEKIGEKRGERKTHKTRLIFKGAEKEKAKAKVGKEGLAQLV